MKDNIPITHSSTQEDQC